MHAMFGDGPRMGRLWGGRDWRGRQHAPWPCCVGGERAPPTLAKIPLPPWCRQIARKVNNSSKDTAASKDRIISVAGASDVFPRQLEEAVISGWWREESSVPGCPVKFQLGQVDMPNYRDRTDIGQDSKACWKRPRLNVAEYKCSWTTSWKLFYWWLEVKLAWHLILEKRPRGEAHCLSVTVPSPTQMPCPRWRTSFRRYRRLRPVAVLRQLSTSCLATALVPLVANLVRELLFGPHTVPPLPPCSRPPKTASHPSLPSPRPNEPPLNSRIIGTDWQEHFKAKPNAVFLLKFGRGSPWKNQE